MGNANNWLATDGSPTTLNNVNMVRQRHRRRAAPQIDTTPPIVTSLVDSPASGTLNAGTTVTLTLKLSEAVTVAGGTPTLTLNDGGTATYTGGSGTNALTFSYTVAAGQNTSDLTVTAVNLNSATVKDSAGNAANLSLTGLTQSGPQIDTTAPTGSSPSPTPTGSSGSPPAPTITLVFPNQRYGKAGGGYTDAHVLTLNGTRWRTGGRGIRRIGAAGHGNCQWQRSMELHHPDTERRYP